ncbi:MAG: hypothetical protein M3Q23_16850 [Actinomycetota bacterium]|nr:hypothetical protein [Actinomycetota bacterium]
MTGSDVMHRELGGFEARLLPVLLEAVEDRASSAAGGASSPGRGPRVRRRIVVRAATLAVAAVVGAVVAANTLAAGADTVQVRATDAIRDPVSVEQQLREQGVDATILVVPVPADVAGTWWDLYFAPRTNVDPEEWSRLLAQVGEGIDPGLPPDVYDQILDRGRNVYHHEVLDIPKDVHGPLTLIAGRAQRPGESLTGLGGELSPAGAFWCMGLERLDPSDAGRAIQGLGYGVRFYYNPQPLAPVGVDPAGDGYVDSPPPGSAITDAWFATPTEVVVDLVPADQADAVRAETGTPTPGSTPPPWGPDCKGT